MNRSHGSSPRRILSSVGLLLVGAIGGFLLHRGIDSGGGRRSSTKPESVRNPVSAVESSIADASGRSAAFEALERGDAEEAGRMAQAADLARSFKPGEFEEAAKLAVRIPLRYRQAYLSALAAKWAESDPKAALEFASSLKEIRSGAITAALTQWLGSQQEEALKWIHDELQGKAGSYAWPAIDVLQGRDPVRALAFINTLPATHVRSYSYQGFFEKWVRADAPAAGKAALAMAPSDSRSASIRYVAGEWAKMNPEAALAWIDQIPEIGLQNEVRQAALTTWANKDPKAALTWASQLNDEVLRNNIEAQMWMALIQRNPDEASRDVLALPEGEMKTRVFKQLAMRRAYQSIPAALELVRQLPEGTQPGVLRSMVQLLKQGEVPDHRGVCELALQLAPGEDRTSALLEVTSKWAKNSPVAAAEWLQKNGTPEEIRNTFPGVAAGWAEQDPVKALEWAKSLSDERTRDFAIERIVMTTSANDPSRAAELLSAELKPERRANAAWVLATNWANRDVEAAANWVQSLPVDSQVPAMRSVARVWATKDYASAAAWLEQIPSGASRDGAVIEFSKTVVDTDPEGAMAWAVSMSDPGKRSEQIQELARRWLRYNKTAAQQWIASTPQLSEEAKTKLLSGK